MHLRHLLHTVSTDEKIHGAKLHTELLPLQYRNHCHHANHYDSQDGIISVMLIK